MPVNIAIDGPAGAGKSTVARQAAKNLGYIYVDTGAMYRAMALYFIRKGILGEDKNSIEAACPEVQISLEFQNGIQKVFMNGEDVTKLIRSEEVGNMASATSGYPAVRKKLVEMQRELAMKKDLVMDGRDIGTCVLPDATVKVYLTASSHVRAQRRFKELQGKGVKCCLEDIEKDIIERDKRDMNRELSPLRQAEDAVLLDTSDMTLKEVLNQLLKLARNS